MYSSEHSYSRQPPAVISCLPFCNPEERFVMEMASYGAKLTQHILRYFQQNDHTSSQKHHFNFNVIWLVKMKADQKVDGYLQNFQI